MMSPFLARESAFSPSADAMAMSWSRSLPSRTERSRVSALMAHLLSWFSASTTDANASSRPFAWPTEG